MQAWLAGLFASIMAQFTAWLVAKGLEIIHGQESHAATDSEIDQKLAGLKAAYKEAFNGQPITPEQKQKLNQAISDFIRNADTGGV